MSEQLTDAQRERNRSWILTLQIYVKKFTEQIFFEKNLKQCSNNFVI